MHPEDVAIENEAKRESAEFGPAIAVELAPRLANLVLIYADASAHDKLDELRELFWAELLPKAVARAKRRTT